MSNRMYGGGAKPNAGGSGEAVINPITVTPTTSRRIITSTSSVDGYAPITVKAVTSSIDSNITSSNIVDGVTILDVQGSATILNGETITVTPTTSQQVITPTSPKNGITQATVEAVTSSIDSNIVAGNIKKDVEILNVTGTYEPNLTTKSITANGTYAASSDNADGYSSVTVNVAPNHGGRYLVRVYDYDGTILKEDWLNTGATFEMPTPPSHSRLVFDGWCCNVEITNNTLTVGHSDIIAGPYYHPVSNMTEIDVLVRDYMVGDTNYVVKIPFLTDESYGATVDWGDGSAVETLQYTGTVQTAMTHSYSAAGLYTIKTTGTLGTLGGTPTSGQKTGPTFSSMVVGIYAAGGQAISFQTLSGSNSYGIQYLTLPPVLSSCSIAYCGALRFIPLPLPTNELTTIPELNNCWSTYFAIPDNFTVGGNIKSCQSAEYVGIPEGVDSFGTNSYLYFYALKRFCVPPAVSTFSFAVLKNCYSLKEVDFTGHSSVCGLAVPSYGPIAVAQKDFKILVPQSLENSWKTATNWALYADFIEGV